MAIEHAPGRCGTPGTRPSSRRWKDLCQWSTISLSGTFCRGQHLLLPQARLHLLRQPLPGTTSGQTPPTHSPVLLPSQYFLVKGFAEFFPQVSLSLMILDICKFCCLYILVLFAFSCGRQKHLKNWSVEFMSNNLKRNFIGSFQSEKKPTFLSYYLTWFFSLVCPLKVPSTEKLI